MGIQLLGLLLFVGCLTFNSMNAAVRMRESNPKPECFMIEEFEVSRAFLDTVYAVLYEWQNYAEDDEFFIILRLAKEQEFSDRAFERVKKTLCEAHFLDECNQLKPLFKLVVNALVIEQKSESEYNQQTPILFSIDDAIKYGRKKKQKSKSRIKIWAE